MTAQKKKGKLKQEPDQSEGFGKLLSRRSRRAIVVMFCCLLILSVSFLLWNNSGARAPQTLEDPKTRERPRTEIPKAAVLDGLYVTSPNVTFLQSVQSCLSNAGFEVDVFQGENVTIDLMRNVAGYKVLILRLHSAVHSDGFLYLFSGEKYSQSKYTAEQLSGGVRKGVTLEGNEFFAINAVFLGGNKPAGLNGSTIILMGCNGTCDTYSIQRLLDKGVSTFIGWNGYVDLPHSDQATLTLVRGLYEERRTVKVAVEEAMLEVGSDPLYGTVLEYQTR